MLKTYQENRNHPLLSYMLFPTKKPTVLLYLLLSCIVIGYDYQLVDNHRLRSFNSFNKIINFSNLNKK